MHYSFNQTVKTIIYTLAALIAFAGNSVLCRLALGNDGIDGASFTVIRLLSGIIMLLLLVKLSAPRKASPPTSSWWAAGMLFIYAVTFSYAYLTLDTATGALVLFGAVQLTIISISFIRGNRLHFFEYSGALIAFLGLVYLVLPELTQPSLIGFVLMAFSGLAWGIYTLMGRHSVHPLQETASNFTRTLPMTLALWAATVQYSEITRTGVILAVLSGAVASALGYTIWYLALKNLSAVQAAVVQLCVPVLAGAGGILFNYEQFSQHLLISSLLVLGGVMTVVLGKHHVTRAQQCY